jgi:hypothetical protein
MAQPCKFLLSCLASVSDYRWTVAGTGRLTGCLDVIGYYQVPMYEALGFTGGKSILVSGIYNCVGPIASK